MIDSALLKRKLHEAGFSACGLTRAVPVSEERRRQVSAWLDQGRHAGMDYLARNTDKRFDPRQLVEGAQTIVCAAVNYNPGETLRPGGPGHWRLARYAYGTDYHEVVKAMLRQVMTVMGWAEGTDGRCFVDTAPIDEKYWAEQCGIGWRGRHTQLVIPGLGSYFVLGEMVLIHPADRYDEPARNRCGNCLACVDACPMQALDAGGLDARKCLSYLTIENREPIPAEAQKCMGDCFYGCDRCAEACPWNRRFARRTEVGPLQARPEILAMTPRDWAGLTLEQYRMLFRKSAVKRAKYEGLLRNISCMEMPDEKGVF